MLSVILPTYNEAENIPVMVAEIARILMTRPHEIIIVDDDSPDQTWKVAEDMRTQYPELKVLRRVGRRGLSSAVVEGFEMATGEVLAVMDADGQHDTGLLLKLEDAITQGADIAVGSRYIAGGSVGDWNTVRKIISRVATRMAYMLLRVGVKDPMSGFFALRTDLFRSIRPNLNPTGFKVLLDVLVNTPRKSTVVEVPFTFAPRMAGDSKLSGKVQLEFLSYLYSATLGRHLPPLSLLFLVIMALVTLFFLPRALALSDLYLSSQARGEVMRAVDTVADREGWVKSDVELLRVHADGVRILYREHKLYPHSPRCYDVSFADFQLQPCTE
jgi:dolichol-phosphate mannosyltransferase